MLVSLQDGTSRQYYAVFDGHGGVDAANYAATHLHVLLGQQGALASDPDTAFKEAFTRTDHMFRGKARREVRCITTPEPAGPGSPGSPGVQGCLYFHVGMGFLEQHVHGADMVRPI